MVGSDFHNVWQENETNHFKVWWVNQGPTYPKARADGYIWAPTPVSGGKTFAHWESMTEVEQGDMIINFSQKDIMALSVAKSKAHIFTNRKKDGWRIDLDYHDLLRPISHEEIKPMMDMINESIEKNKPFNSLKGINQGYLFHFSLTGFRMLVERFPDRFPESIKPVLGLGPDTRFSTFLSKRGLFFDQDIVERYILSLKTKPFVILTGKAGTGKTSLAHMFARYLDEKKRNDESLTEESDLLSRRWFKMSYNDKDIVNAFEGGDKKINLVRKTILKDGIMSLYGLDSKKNIDINQKKMMKELREGDVIIAYQGGYTLGGIGVVIQSQFFDDSGDAFESFFESTKNFIRMDWLFKGPLKINDFFLDDQRIPAFSMWGEAIHALTPEQIRLFSDYLYTKDIQINEYGVYTRSRTYEIVSVGSDWTDMSPLLGSMDNRNVENYKTTKALELILNAGKVLKRGMDTPFFLILDNMNASCVEHYLSEILSAWETGETIALHREDDISQYSDIPKDLSLPSNLFIIGTLSGDNQAKTPVSRILDQANVIELNSFSADDYLCLNERPRTFSRDLTFQGSVMADHMKPEDIRRLMSGVVLDADHPGDVVEVLAEHLDFISNMLKSSGFHIGFRAMNDIIRYIYLSWEAHEKPMIFNPWVEALDCQIVQRILPGIQGVGTLHLKNTLKSLYCFCFTGLADQARTGLDKGELIPELLERHAGDARFVRSAFKIGHMLDILEKQGSLTVTS